MFFEGVRVSTWAMLLLFVYLSVWRRNARPLLAAAAWMTGFEAAYQLTSIATGHRVPSNVGDAVALSITLGVVNVPLAWRVGIKPNLRVMAIVALLWLVWVAAGFDSNVHSMVGFNALNEAMNEAAKTGWALAYVWSLWPRREVQRSILQLSKA